MFDLGDFSLTTAPNIPTIDILERLIAVFEGITTQGSILNTYSRIKTVLLLLLLCLSNILKVAIVCRL